jgi:hypothetical protein
MKYANCNLVLVFCVVIILGNGAANMAFSSGPAVDNLSPSEIVNEARGDCAPLRASTSENGCMDGSAQQESGCDSGTEAGN